MYDIQYMNIQKERESFLVAIKIYQFVITSSKQIATLEEWVAFIANDNRYIIKIFISLLIFALSRIVQ